MTIEKRNGGYLIYGIVNGFLFSRFFIGYTKREAVQLFREAARKQK